MFLNLFVHLFLFCDFNYFYDENHSVPTFYNLMFHNKYIYIYVYIYLLARTFSIWSSILQYIICTRIYFTNMLLLLLRQVPWSIKKAECWRTDVFKLWCWRRLLRAPWTARRSNQSILKEISPEYSLEGLMLSWNSKTLAAWYEELTHWKRPWCRERLKAGGEGEDRGWDGWMASLTRWTWVWANSRSWW